MLDVYNVIPFDDPDGGVWKQGFDISYDHAEVQRQKKLEVVVTPHSHTDPENMLASCCSDVRIDFTGRSQKTAQ
uniref:Glycoside hydrolase family 38 N-terminal domain-containing protein n=1 Tax=Parascaris equorum TaxID=6256 RepID=A0A914RM33_PAREQ